MAIFLARRIFRKVHGLLVPPLTVGIVGDDHAFHAAHRADAGDDAGAHLERAAVGRQRAQLEKRGIRVDEQLDAFPGRQLAAGVVTLDVLGTAARKRFGEFGVDLVES